VVQVHLGPPGHSPSTLRVLLAARGRPPFDHLGSQYTWFAFTVHLIDGPLGPPPSSSMCGRIESRSPRSTSPCMEVITGEVRQEIMLPATVAYRDIVCVIKQNAKGGRRRLGGLASVHSTGAAMTEGIAMLKIPEDFKLSVPSTRALDLLHERIEKGHELLTVAMRWSDSRSSKSAVLAKSDVEDLGDSAKRWHDENHVLLKSMLSNTIIDSRWAGRRLFGRLLESIREDIKQELGDLESLKYRIEVGLQLTSRPLGIRRCGGRIRCSRRHF
jgi:hypothetical protein